MFILKGALFPDGHVKYIFVYFFALFNNLTQFLTALQQHFTGDGQPAALRRLLLWSTLKSDGFPIDRHAKASKKFPDSGFGLKKTL